MLTFEIYANGILWGEWDAETAEEAIQIAANDVGTDGNTDDMIAVQVMLPYHDVRIKRYEPETGSQMPAYMEEKSGGEWVSIADHVATVSEMEGKITEVEKQIEALRSCLSACVSLMEENMDCDTPSASRHIKEAAMLMEKTNE